MSESKYTRKWCKAQEAHGALTYPLVASRYAPAGWPDRFYAHFRWQGFIEFKSFAGKLQKPQVKVHTALMQRRQNVIVVRFSKDSTCLRIEKPSVQPLDLDASVIEYIPSDWTNWGGFLDAVTGVPGLPKELG